MLYIFDRDEKVVGFLQSNSDRNKNIYYNDVLTEILSSGADSFAFTTISDRDTSKNLTVGNYIAFKKGDKFKLMQIMEVNESRENALTKEIYCESAGLELINTVYSGSKMSTVNIESFLKNVLQDTNWEVGYIDSNLTKTLSLEIEEKEVYSIIQEYLYDFEAEIDFRVEIKGNRIVGRYIDVYSKRGRNNGRRLEINRDIKSISRKVSLTEYATKLIGEGKNGLNFRDISMSGEINKPLGQNFVVNEEAYSRINNKGKHITRKFTYDTEDAYELLRQTYKALKEYSEPKVTYEVDADILNFDDIEIGDYVSISDLSFTPPLLVTARISELETSKTNKYANKAILSNFNEVRSGISSIFPIPGDNIVSGSIGGEQMNPDYVDSIISDSVNTTMIKTEILLANKANIEDLNAANAEIENLKVNKAEITDLNATNANIENLKADKADIADLNATNATIEDLKANKADITELNAINANIDKLTANKAEITELEAVKADIGSLTAGKADIGMLDSINANIEFLNAGYAKIEDLDANKANIEDLNATNATIENLKANVANIDKLVANKADIEDLNATNANIEKLVAKDAQIENLVSEKADITQLNAANANIGTLTANLAQVETLVAKKANIGDLNAANAEISNLKANHAELGVLISQKADIEDLNAANASIDNLQANKANITELNAAVGEITQLKSEVAEIGQLKSDVADIEHILAGNITADNIAAGAVTADKIQTGAITAGSGIIADGAIGSAQISTVDAGKISAGKIDTSKVEVAGADGHLRIKGNRLQVFNGTGSNAIERVSLGDVNGNGSIYGLRVRGTDGRTVLLDENGVTSEGITNGAITNDKISDDANIDGAKLNINSVVNKINEDGTETIQGTKIEVDGTTLNTKLSTITNKQTEDSNKISQAQSQITANTNAIKLKVDEQTYTADKRDMTSKLEKNTSEITTMKGQIALKVERTDIENAKSEMEGVIDTKVDSAKAEIKVTTDAISQNVSNLSQTVSTKADGSTVTTLSNKVGSLETSVNGISGKVTNLEKTTTTLGGQVSNAQNAADSAASKANNAQSTANTANNTANVNKNNITNLQGEVSTVKSDIASLEVTTSGISQKVSSVESTTATLTTKVTDAQNSANSANSKIDGLQVGGRNIFKNSGFTQGTSSWNTYSCNNLQIINEPLSISGKAINFVSTGGGIYQRNTVGGENTPYPNGENYTVSGYVKCSSTAELRVALEGVTTKYVRPSSANTWVYFSHQFTGNGTAHTFTFYGVNGNVYTLKDLKLEKGNKPTDWSPAPEDVDSAINSVDGKVTTLQGEYNTTKSKVATLETNLDGITQRVSSTESTTTTLTNRVNTVESTANTAKSTADSAKTNATNAQNTANTANSNATNALNTANSTNTKLNNLQIGGRNLIRKADVTQNNSTATFNDSTKTWTIKATAGAGSTWGCGLILKNKNILVPYGKSYVLSFEIKVPRNCSWNCDVNNYPITGSSWNSNDNDNGSKRSTSSKSLTANQWIKCWVKWENTNANNTNKVDLYDNSHFGVVMQNETSDMTYEIRNVQGELGNMPTEYTPAPEDIDSAINTIDGKANNALERKMGINLIVNQGTFAPNQPNKEGEFYIHGFDANGNKADVDGYIINPNTGAKITIAKTSINPNDKLPFNQEIYLCYSNRLWLAWYSTSEKSWKTVDANPNTYQNTVSNLTWNDSQLVLGVVVMSSTEMCASGVLFDSPKNYREAVGQTIEFTTTKQQVTSIQADLSGITSRVSSAETNIEKISNASSQNLLYNSDFRIMKGSLPDGWTVNDNSKITLDTNSTLLDGIPTFWFNVTGLTENAWKAVYSPFIDAKAGEKFVASAYVKGHNNWSTLDAGGRLEIEYYNDSSRLATSGASINKSNLNWQRLVAKGTAPTGTTRVRIRVHPTRNGQFNMSKPMLQYGETVTGWDRGFDIKNLTTRLATAESKITEDAITNTVKKNFYTKSETDNQITSKGYQTESEVQQTVNGLEVKVKQSGGYNNLFNSGFKRGTSYWSEHLYGTATNKSISTWDDNNQYILPNTKALVIRATNPTDRYGVHQNVKVKEGATYSISALSAGHRNTKQLITIRKASDGTHIANIEASPIGAGKNINNWRKMEGTFTIPSGCTEITVCLYMVGTGNNSDAYVWYTNVLLSEGKLVNEWSPHPSEIYDGITTIDKDGVTVTASNVKSKTNMSANGFKITKTDTNEDVFKVNSDGTLYMKGQITVTGGSVPTSNLSGTISSNQLNSSITSDINNAKNNASSALSTANAAKSTADSVNTTVNNGKTNWDNAYNRVNQWAYGAVTGNTTIDGGYIQTNTIVAEKIALGDFTNYAELNANTLSKWGWTSVADSSATSNPWFQKNSISRDNQISKYYTCNGGESLRIKADIFTSVYGQTTNGGTATATARPVGIMIFTINANGTREYICNQRITAANTSGTTGTVNNVVTLPTTARQFAVYVQIDGYPTFSGVLRVRNVQVTKMSSGELIVDGAITAGKISSGAITTDKLGANAVTAAKIAAGTITASKIASEAITTDKLGANAVTAAKIAAGTITSDRIASRTITADRIKAGAITANEIAANTITANKIASRTITADRIAAGAITANEIKASTITATQMAANSITSDKIAAGAITANKIASGAITATMITSGTLDASKVNVTNLNASNITSGTISGDRIKGGTLSATNEINFVGGARIFGNSGAYDAGLFISAQQHELMHGNVYIGENLNVSKGFKVTGATTLNGTVTCNALNSNGQISAKGLSITGNVGVSNQLNAIKLVTNGIDVYGYTNLDGNVHVSGNLGIVGDLTVRNKAIYGMNNIALARGTVYLPQGGGNNTTDYLRIGGGFMACVDSGNFHFLTRNGNATRIYASNVSTSYSLASVAQVANYENRSIFDEINSVNVVDTEEGLRLIDNHIRLLNEEEDIQEENVSKAVYTTYNEKTEQEEVNIDYTAAISTLWKAVQELKQEVEMLKNKNEGEL